MKKIALLAFILFFLSAGCAPRDNHLKKLATEGVINRNAALVNSVSIEINAPVNEIWNTIIDVQKWPSWNPGISIVLANGILFDGDNFAFKTSKKVHAKILHFDKYKKLAWFSTSLKYKSVMQWDFEQISKNITRVTLGESRDGFFMNFESEKKHRRELGDWLENLKYKSELVEF